MDKANLLESHKKSEDIVFIFRKEKENVMMLLTKLSSIQHLFRMKGVTYPFLLGILLSLALTSCSEAIMPSGDMQSTPSTSTPSTRIPSTNICSTQGDNANSLIHVTVDCSSPTGISQFSPGISHILKFRL